MSSIGSGVGLIGTGSNSGVICQMIGLGAMDAYLIKGASVTFFRFRYARYTNFAMEGVGQTFQTTPQFGGHSQIMLNRVGDLVYYMYAVVELPAIRAVRHGKSHSNNNMADDAMHSDGGGGDYSYGKPNGASQYPAAQGYNAGAAASCHCNGAASADCAAHQYSASYGNSDAEAYSNECDSVPADDKPWVHYANAVGQLLIRRAVLVVGGHQTDQLYSDYLYMWEELTGKAGKRLREMIGKRKSRKQLIKDAREKQRFYVPLPWYFTQTSGNALPLCSLQFHGVSVHIDWERLSKCVVVSHDDVTPVKVEDGCKLGANDLKAWLDTTYIYLDIQERNRFSLADFDQLITQTQMHSVTSSHTSNVSMQIPFNHPISVLMWAVRRKYNEDKNNYFNYAGINGKDPIEEVSLRFNNLPRFQGREGKYYRLVQPYQHFSSVPKAFVYAYSFALFPEEPQPSGSVNMSRIDNVEMQFTLQAGLEKEQTTIIMIAKNFNILRYSSGLAGCLFNA